MHIGDNTLFSTNRAIYICIFNGIYLLSTEWKVYMHTQV